MKSYLKSIFTVCLISTFFVLSASGTDIKVSQAGGGYQIWWEAEDFDDRDPEEGYKLGEEAAEMDNRIVITEGFYGTDVTMFPGDSARTDAKDWWGLYSFDLPSGASPGTWYFWSRVSFVGASGDLESHRLWVLNDPGDGNTIPETYRADEIEDTDDRLFADVADFPLEPEWAWHGRNSVMEGLDKELQAGSNVVMVWERESGFDSIYMDVMMFASDVAYMPSDQDYEAAVPFAAVEPGEKIPLTWGQIKRMY
jgi:hypothetical protein